MKVFVDAGVMPVGGGDRVVGMITDRDIAVGAVAEGKGPQTQVREVMSPEVKYCFEDDTDAVARNMAEIQVRRLPVVNHDKRVVGIIALRDLAVIDGARAL
jgi:CBS domain-containing protein